MDLLAEFKQLIITPWHWSISGLGLAFIFWALLKSGRQFGLSSSFKSLCTISGAGKIHSFFTWNGTTETWRLLFLGGTAVGGWLTIQFLSNGAPVQISPSTLQGLKDLGLSAPQSFSFFPEGLLNASNFSGLLLALTGGILIGFGSRMGNGCTSGHAISGLSFLQPSSLIAVLGFFLGGLLMTHFIFPFLNETIILVP